MSRLVVLVLILVVCAGCEGGDSGDESSVACAPPPPTVPAPSLPDGIPSPAGVVYTSVSKDAASLRAEGYAPGSVDEVVAAYRSAFASRTLLTLGSPDEEGDRVTMSIGGPSTQGSVTLTRVCDRVAVLLDLGPLTGP